MQYFRPSLGFIGAGVTGTALASQLYIRGYNIAAVNSRNITSSECLAKLVPNCRICRTAQDVADIAQAVFITTPDDIIADIAANLDWHSGQTVIHCSGVHSIDVLEPAKTCGANICCLHPLQTFASLEQAINNISGSTFALEGDEEAVTLATEMATALNGNIIRLKAGDKALYHAAAVILSNYSVTLMKMAADLWSSFGIGGEDAVKALLPLLKGTVNNIERIGIPDCLTGPIARGDIGTVQKHLDILRKEHPSVSNVYRMLGLKTIPLALAKGRISLDTANEMRNLLEEKEITHSFLTPNFYEEIGFTIPAEQRMSTQEK